LQIGVETGVFGLLLFLSLLVIIGQSLLRIRETSPLALPTALMLVSVCVAGLFLHAWEDSAVAYTLWILVAAALSSRKSPQTA
jgi:multidrug transporter EmrE-like cation transporter